MIEKKKKKKRKKRKSRFHTGVYTSVKTSEQCKFRSGWEEKYMIRLDEDPRVLTWSYEPFFIAYVSNKKSGRVRKYFPDFIVTLTDGTKILVEIKQKRKLDTPTVRRKAAAAEEWCRANGASYKILTEIELKDIGLL